MAVKIKLKRLGKTRNPQYRIVIADARTARGGRAIEEIGIYQPRQEPSLIRVDSERAQHWLGVGAQPTEAVLRILKVTGDWQRFKGLPGAEGTLRIAEPKADKQRVFEAAVRSAEESGRAPRAKAPAPPAAPVVAEAAAEVPAEAAPVEAEVPAEAAPVEAEVPAEAAPVEAEVPAEAAPVEAEVPAEAAPAEAAAPVEAAEVAATEAVAETPAEGAGQTPSA